MSELPTFVEQDFAAYADKRQRDPEYNAFRLVVRRKLDAHGKAAIKELAKAKGLKLTSRTSLNHPHATNRMRVSSQLVYLSRAPKDKKALGAIVGPALGKDVDTHYIQITLAMQVDETGIEQALRIHKMAWWDGLNLKNRIKDLAEMDLLGDLLNGLPNGFILFMDNWKKEYRCGEISPQELGRYSQTYTPGEHWLHLQRRIDAQAAIARGAEIADWGREGFHALADIYAFASWSPENNRLFNEEGKIV